MLNKNFKKLVLLVILAFTLSGTFLLTPIVNAQVNVAYDTPADGFDSTLQPPNWHVSSYWNTTAPTAVPEKLNVTYNGSTFQADGVTLNSSTYGYGAYSTSVNLIPNTPYVMSGYVKATNIEINPIHLDYSNKGPFGFSRFDEINQQSNSKTYTAHLLNPLTNSTDGWIKLDFHFISSSSGLTYLDCNLGGYCCDTKGTVEFAGLTLKQDSSYKTVSHSDFVAAVPVSQLVDYSVSDSALDSWGSKLNGATQKLKELTGINDSRISQIYMLNDTALEEETKVDFAYAGIPCIFSAAASNFTFHYAVNQDAVEHSQLHELGHTYNTDHSGIWNFNDEVFANVRAAYTAVQNNIKVRFWTTDTSNIPTYQGISYKQFYDSKLAEYISNPTENAKGYELFATAGIYLRMVYGDASVGLPPLGWNTLKTFFTNGTSTSYNPTSGIYLDPNRGYTNDFKVFTQSLNIIAQITGKSASEIANYVPNGFYWNWYNNPSQYPFVSIN